jgi:quinol-cytochrome oxidoreductase complex cytochrome b subunit
MKRRPSFFEHLHPPTIPAREARFRYTFGLGGLSVLLCLVLLVTGALELFYYAPSAEAANASVQQLTHLIPYGWLVRGLHYWASQALVVTAALHLLRVVLTGGYKRPRRFNWLLGLSLLVAIVLLDFTGLVLRWDNHIAWALTVGTNLLKTVPLVGSALYTYAVGGSEIGGATVIRFYGWHIFGLILPASIILIWHVFRVRRDGGISHQEPPETTEPSEKKPVPQRIHRSELLRREILAALIGMAVLLGLTIGLPPSVGPQADFSNLPPDATAPWFFVWVQELLRLGDPFWMGVLIPLGVLSALALVPYALDRDPSGAGRWFNPQGRLAQAVVLIIALSVLGLIVWGSLT